MCRDCVYGNALSINSELSFLLPGGGGGGGFANFGDMNSVPQPMSSQPVQPAQPSFMPPAPTGQRSPEKSMKLTCNSFVKPIYHSRCEKPIFDFI